MNDKAQLQALGEHLRTVVTLKVELSIETLAQLIRQKGALREKASLTGRDCYELVTAKGVYKAPTYEGFWAPCDFVSIEPVEGGERYDTRDVIEGALEDSEIVAALNSATVCWSPAR